LNYEFTSLEREKPPKYGWKVLEGRDHLYLLSLDYRFKERLSLDFLFPYSRKYEKVEIDGILRVRKVKGFGDPIMMIKFTPFRNFSSLRNIFIPSIALGLKLPLGEFRGEDSLGPLPRTFQPGTGSFDFLVALYLYESWNPNWILLFNSFYRLNGTNSDGFHLGNSLRLTLRLQSLNFYPLGLSLGLRYWRGWKDKLRSYPYKDSGGWELLGIGSAFYNLSGFIITAEMNLPLLRELYGNQLARKFTVSVGLGKNI
jgi:hypothetical protein